MYSQLTEFIIHCFPINCQNVSSLYFLKISVTLAFRWSEGEEGRQGRRERTDFYHCDIYLVMQKMETQKKEVCRKKK